MTGINKRWIFLKSLVGSHDLSFSSKKFCFPKVQTKLLMALVAIDNKNSVSKQHKASFFQVSVVPVLYKSI